VSIKVWSWLLLLLLWLQSFLQLPFNLLLVVILGQLTLEKNPVLLLLEPFKLIFSMLRIFLGVLTIYPFGSLFNFPFNLLLELIVGHLMTGHVGLL
jgi:hypothetical protein